MADDKAESTTYITLPAQELEPRTIGPCDNCGERPGTEEWVGDGGMLAWTHGFSQWWCKICCLRMQIRHAEERAAALPGMRAELEHLLLLERENLIR